MLKVSVSPEYLLDVLECFIFTRIFSHKKPGEKIDLQNISALDKEKLRREYFKRCPTNKFSYTNNRLLISKGSVAIFIEPNNKVSYIKIDKWAALYFSKYYHDNAEVLQF